MHLLEAPPKFHVFQTPHIKTSAPAWDTQKRQWADATRHGKANERLLQAAPNDFITAPAQPITYTRTAQMWPGSRDFEHRAREQKEAVQAPATERTARPSRCDEAHAALREEEKQLPFRTDTRKDPHCADRCQSLRELASTTSGGRNGRVRAERFLPGFRPSHSEEPESQEQRPCRDRATSFRSQNPTQ